MKTLDKPSSGACGEIIASRNHYGPYVRRPVRPPKRRAKRPTASQRVSQAEKRTVARAMEALTEAQIRGWVIAAEQVLSKSRLDAPGRPKLSVNPVGRLIITNKGRIALKLEVSGRPAAAIMVFGAKPCRRTILKCFKCPRIGPLPEPEGGVSDITRQYVKKHGRPKVGQRVFIRTRQYFDGGPEERFEETSAVVSAPEARNRPAKVV